MSPDGNGREILFHHPLPIAENPRSGSQVRPRRMIDAFRANGYEVVEVTGYTSQRVPLMRSIARDIRRGRRFEFCYSESVNSPTALSDPHHLPTHPLADPIFFRTLKRAGIPSGLFYRDIYWRFDEYRREVPLHKRAVSIPFLRFDLAWYARYVDVVYLPSFGMAEPIPHHDRFTFEELPPGVAVEQLDREAETASGAATSPGPLRLFYVGSVSPPIYDISPLLRAVEATSGVELDLCCPESEKSVLGAYPVGVADAVEVHHASGNDLVALYRDVDVACLIMGPHPYRDFAMPVKLFEAIGYGKPLISNAETAAGRFVSSNGIGWTFEDEGELSELLSGLATDPERVRSVTEQVRSAAPLHTWKARAASVAERLTTLSQPGAGRP